MPFKSDRQRRYLYSQHPEVAKKWSKEEKRKRKSRRMAMKDRM